jgi:DNA-binding response OmpR family regulator
MTTILVAEDDEDVRDLVVFKLELAGYLVVAVDNGLAVLDTARSVVPDLAILDVMMPGRNGVDVCRELRTDPATGHVPVILLTARSQEVDVDAGFRAGASDYLIKPFSPRELVNRVSSVLARSGR